MSTILFQGLQSCLEPQPKEPTTTLRLKLAAPKSLIDTTNPKEVVENFHDENITTSKITKKPDVGSWDFLPSLSNTSQNPQNDLKPMTFNSYPSLKLSQKSLELCTENLGSETGSDTSESSIFSFETQTKRSSTTQQRCDSHQISSQKKVNSRSFPPPLTSIRASTSLQFRPHREGGRLVIEAVEAPSTRTCFEAERSNGRLQLRLLKNCEFFSEQKVMDQENSEDNNDNIEAGEEVKEEIKKRGGEDMKNVGELDENDGYMKKDMEGNTKEVGVEMGIEKFQRHGRCKEGPHGADKGLCSWEQFWVAT